MRRSFLTTFLAAGTLAVAGCADTPEGPVAPAEVVRPNLTVVSGATLRAQIDALLSGTARTAAHLQLYRVEQDIRYRRPWLYVDALALAAIPLHVRERDGIPPEKLENLFQFLCGISELIKPHLPAWLAAIDFCLINAGHLADDAKVQVVSNALGATVTTERQTFSLDIEPNSMFDAAGNSVPFVVVVVLPLNRQPPEGDGDPHPCPEPWDEEFPQDEVDCYEEFYDLSVIPPVQFNPAADLEICQLDPSSDNVNAPSSDVLPRLKLFTKDADNVVRILGSDGQTDADAVCIDDNIEHAIGPIDWSRTGMRNALARLERFGSRALVVFRPTVLYADNVPTHGDIFGELLLGNVVGAIDEIDLGPRDVACVGTLPPGTYRNVTVPEGATCTMRSSTLTGMLTALSGSTVSAFDNTIAGGVQADGPSRMHLFGGSVGGNVRIAGGTGVAGIYDFVVDGVALSGDVHVLNNTGQVWVVRNQFSETGNIIVEDNVITEDVPAPDLTIDDNSGPQTIEVLRNSGPASKQVSGNNATQRISCFDNTPTLGSSGNTAPTLEGQCAPPIGP